MARIIKFRAWDTEKNKWMIPEDVYDQLENQARWNPEIGETFPLMQFTGLQDSKGVDIYEGDIVQGTGDYKCVIVFEDGSFLVRNESMSTNFISMPNYFEIIGNIYETPNLIKHGN